jgi:hypothetical protein
LITVQKKEEKTHKIEFVGKLWKKDVQIEKINVVGMNEIYVVYLFCFCEMLKILIVQGHVFLLNSFFLSLTISVSALPLFL